MAQREGRSLSDMARRAIEAGLEALEGPSDEVRRRRIEALQALAEMRRADEERHGAYPGDLIAEVRAQRERGLEHVWRGE
jgi:hypothetical protein